MVKHWKYGTNLVNVHQVTTSWFQITESHPLSKHSITLLPCGCISSIQGYIFFGQVQGVSNFTEENHISEDNFNIAIQIWNQPIIRWVFVSDSNTHTAYSNKQKNCVDICDVVTSRGYGVFDLYIIYDYWNYYLSVPCLIISIVYCVFLLNQTYQVKLKKILFVDSKMGTSCSSNIYDRREWSSIGTRSIFDKHKDGKYGGFRTRAQSDPTSDSARVASAVCTCHKKALVVNGGHSTSGLISQTTTQSSTCDNSECLSPNDVFEATTSPLSNNRLSPNVNSSGHIKLSRVGGSATARSTTNCDVSPHRLLTRRNRSPNYRPISLDFRSANRSSVAERQRSQSWSNSKLLSKDNFKGTNTSLQTSFPWSERYLKGNTNHTLGNTIPKSGQFLSNTISQGSPKLPNIEQHDPDCPLYIKPFQSPKLSISKKERQLLDDFDDDWTPITRRRAVSESQSTRPRRFFPHTLDSTDLNHSQDHAHVHWADEAKGTSLSTSVFLSTIRPRSYSHGAMDSAPNRPILKK